MSFGDGGENIKKTPGMAISAMPGVPHTTQPNILRVFYLIASAIQEIFRPKALPIR